MPDTKRKIHFNKTPISSGKIAGGKNFDGLFEAYKTAAVASAPAGSAISLVGIVKIGFVTVAVLLTMLVTVLIVGKKTEEKEKIARKKTAAVISTDASGQLLPEQQKNQNNQSELHNNSSSNLADESAGQKAGNSLDTTKSVMYIKKEVAEKKRAQRLTKKITNKNKQQTKNKRSVVTNNNSANSVSTKEEPSFPSEKSLKQRSVKNKKNNQARKSNTSNNMSDATTGFTSNSILPVTEGENNSVKRNKKKANKSPEQDVNGTTSLYNKSTEQQHNKNNETISVSSVSFLERKPFALNSFAAYTDDVEKGIILPNPSDDYARRRDFDPKYTVGVKGTSFTSIYQLQNLSKYNAPRWVESFYFSDDSTVYSTIITTDVLSGYNVGVSGSLKLFNRCYAEVDMSYLRRYFVTYTHISPSFSISSPPQNVVLNNIQADLGLSYWFGKGNLEFGINPGISKRLINSTKSSYLNVENKDEDKYTMAAATRFPLSAYSWFSKISFRYNFNRTQIRVDLGMHQNDLLVDGNFYETISTSAGVYYKLY